MYVSRWSKCFKLFTEYYFCVLLDLNEPRNYRLRYAFLHRTNGFAILSLLHLKRPASRPDRLQRATWTLLAHDATWPITVDLILTPFLLNETDFSFNCIRRKYHKYHKILSFVFILVVVYRDVLSKNSPKFKSFYVAEIFSFLPWNLSWLLLLLCLRFLQIFIIFCSSWNLWRLFF